MRKAYRRRVVIEDDGSEFIKRSAVLLEALSNPVRLTVLTHIIDKEINVSNLSKIVGISQSALSQHLFKLRSSGLVNTRRDGLLIHYSCTSPAVMQIIQTLAEIFPTAKAPVHARKI